MKLFAFLLLLATLSIINADGAQLLHKRVTQFAKCPIDDPGVTVLSVKLSPDPIVLGKSLDVTISGTLNEDIAAGDTDTVVESAFLDPTFVPVTEPTSVAFCESKGIKCPVPKGTQFSTVLTVQVPDQLPKGTTIVGDVYSYAEDAFLGCALSVPVA